MDVGAAQVEGVGAQSLILAAGQSRGDDAAHDGGVQLDLGAEVGARESGRGVRGDGCSGDNEAGGAPHGTQQRGHVPHFEAPLEGDVVGSSSHKGPPVEFAATRVGDRVDAGVGGKQVEALAGDDVKGSSIFAKIMQAAQSGKTLFPFTTGKSLFDFMKVDELARQIALASLQTKIAGVTNICTGKPESLASCVERFIQEHDLPIRLDYGKFPDRPYDSPGVWGDSTKIEQIQALYPLPGLTEAKTEKME